MLQHKQEKCENVNETDEGRRRTVSDHNSSLSTLYSGEVTRAPHAGAITRLWDV